MEAYTIPQDIHTVYVQATSFPQGVKAAHEKLRATVPDSDGRRFFGISHPNEKWEIIYQAVAEELHPGEAASFGLETFTIRKGSYISEVLKDWMKQEGKIKEIFEKLLAHSDTSRNGYCLEEYLNETDMRLMVVLE
jgi:hypothetical protein